MEKKERKQTKYKKNYTIVEFILDLKKNIKDKKKIKNLKE